CLLRYAKLPPDRSCAYTAPFLDGSEEPTLAVVQIRVINRVTNRATIRAIVILGADAATLAATDRSIPRGPIPVARRSTRLNEEFQDLDAPAGRQNGFERGVGIT